MAASPRRISKSVSAETLINSRSDHGVYRESHEEGKTKPRGRRQRMMAKHGSSLQLYIPSGDRSYKPPTSRACRTPSPSMLLNRRRSPCAVLQHSSNARSNSPRRRHLSPDSANVELLRRRIIRAQRARLYLLQQPGPNTFLVAGDSPDHKYKVIIGPQTCSCGHGPYCVHILFVMLRVFQLPDYDPQVFARELKNFQVESLFKRYENRRSLRLRLQKGYKKEDTICSTPQPETPKEGSREPEDGEEEQCTICLLDMVDGESLVECLEGCRNHFHHHCIAIWFEERRRQGEALICPLCRATWHQPYDAPSPGSRTLTPIASYQSPFSLSPSFSDLTLGASSGGNVDLPTLPKAEPIPAEHLQKANTWTKVFGGELVPCLFSRDWNIREAAVGRLSHEMVAACSDDALYCAVDILEMLAHDNVYKVYIAVLRCLRTLMFRLPWAPTELKQACQAVIIVVVSKCADANRIIARLSLDFIAAMARKGEEVGKGSLGGVEYLIKCMMEERDASQSWRLLLGKLLAVNRLLEEFPKEFLLEYVKSSESGCKLRNYDKLMDVIELALVATGSCHSTTAELGRQVFVLASRMALPEPTVYKDIYTNMLSKLEPSLQAQLKRRMHVVDSPVCATSSLSARFNRASRPTYLPLEPGSARLKSRVFKYKSKEEKSYHRPDSGVCFTSPGSDLVRQSPADGEQQYPVVPGLTPTGEIVILHPQKEVVEGEPMPSYLEGEHWIRGPLLGTGAFSSCYQARDIKTGRLLAVKELPFSRTSEEEEEKVVTAIHEEILLMSRLKHNNIVRLVGATQQHKSFCMFVEWMAGGSVAKMLEKYGVFSEGVILRYVRQILAGLDYLHDNQILHRDLKGANLLVDCTGQHVRIGDFGAAARLAAQATVTGEFQGQLLGTIAFMAPEVLRGESYGRSCDIWSVGCCIIEMASAKAPWSHLNLSNSLATMYKIASCKEPPPIPKHLMEPTQELALQCLQVDSVKRPPAKELLLHPCLNPTMV